MTSSSPSPQWQPLPSPAIIDALNENEDVEDVVLLSGSGMPEWLKRVTIPPNWQLLELPDNPGQTVARIAVFGPMDNGEWQAAETINVIGCTGWPTFYEVYHSTGRMLRDLHSAHTAVKALPVPPVQRTAALRSSGVALIGERSVWLQQSLYVAGSDQPHASRITVHTILVDSSCREPIADNVAQLSNAVYHAFLGSLPTEQQAR